MTQTATRTPAEEAQVLKDKINALLDKLPDDQPKQLERIYKYVQYVYVYLTK